MDVVFGVDTHKSTLQISAVDHLGKVLDARCFPNEPSGHLDARRWISALSSDPVVGVECSGSYGLAFARGLLRAGYDVKEVPGNLSHAERRLRSKGKSDEIDSVAVARVVLREGDQLSSARNGLNEELRLLADHRARLVKARTTEINRIHAGMVQLQPGYEKRVSRVRSEQSLKRLTTMLRGDRSVRADLVRHSISELRRLAKAIAKADEQIRARVAKSGTSLTQGIGINHGTAARILGEVGDPRALRSAAGFARLSGVAPVPASSGQVVKHRHNRHGNRQLNRCIHMIAVNRCRLDPATKAYMEKKQAEGKSKKEALRCLKRHIANDLFRTMRRDCLALESAA